MFLDDEEATVRIRIRQSFSTLWVAATALLACVVMMLAIIGNARAADMRSISEIVTPQLLLGETVGFDTRTIFSALIVVFSVAAAGLWLRIFRMPVSNASVDRFDEQTSKPR